MIVAILSLSCTNTVVRTFKQDGETKVYDCEILVHPDLVKFIWSEAINLLSAPENPQERRQLAKPYSVACHGLIMREELGTGKNLTD